MPTSLILTRFLYIKDEVELSLITALLKKAPLEVIYYWAYELYYSGFDVFTLMWKIYLDFYYEQNHAFAAYFKKKHGLWILDKDMKHIAYILRNMYNLKASFKVFLMRQYIYKKDDKDLYPTIIYKLQNMIIEERFNWLNNYAKQYHNLLLALDRRHYENICYYLKTLIEARIQLSELKEIICRFFVIKEDHNINSDLLLDTIMAIIARQLYIPPCGTSAVKHIYVAPRQDHLDHLTELEEESIPLTKHGMPQIYNTLMFKRFVAIDDTIGAFELARRTWTTHEELVQELWFHWEYYAMRSPVWLMRLQNFGGTVNDVTKKIVFATEAAEEGFYDLYAYELDELPKEVQAMSMKPLTQMDGWTWYSYVFAEEANNDEGNDNELWQWQW